MGVVKHSVAWSCLQGRGRLNEAQGAIRGFQCSDQGRLIVTILFHNTIILFSQC